MIILYFLLLVCFSFINGNCSFDLPEEKKISVKQGAAIVQGLHDSGLIDGKGEREVLTTLNNLSHPFQPDPSTRTSSSAGRTLDDDSNHHNQPPIVATTPREATLSNKQFNQIIDRHVFSHQAPFSRRSSNVSGVRPPSSHEEREDEEIESDHSQTSLSTATRGDIAERSVDIRREVLEGLYDTGAINTPSSGVTYLARTETVSAARVQPPEGNITTASSATAEKCSCFRAIKACFAKLVRRIRCKSIRIFPLSHKATTPINSYSESSSMAMWE